MLISYFIGKVLQGSSDAHVNQRVLKFICIQRLSFQVLMAKKKKKNPFTVFASAQDGLNVCRENQAHTV